MQTKKEEPKSVNHTELMRTATNKPYFQQA